MRFMEAMEVIIDATFYRLQSCWSNQVIGNERLQRINFTDCTLQLGHHASL